VKSELIQNGSSKSANGAGQHQSAAHSVAKTEQPEERVVMENGAVDTTADMENGGKEVAGVVDAIAGHNSNLENYRQEGETLH
jgi:hypothetical protein